jgi:hypothetical protein
MASYDTLAKLKDHPEWLAPRSDVRVFLGEPGAPEAAKTTVEPGNAFSPGMMTFGVAWWLRFPKSGRFFAPEAAPLSDLAWSYEAGHLPIIHCDVKQNGFAVRHSLFQDGTFTRRDEAVCARLQVTNTARQPEAVQVFIALRALGPAGGEVKTMKVGADGRSLWNAERRLPLLGVDAPPDAIGCGVGDPSVSARHGVSARWRRSRRGCSRRRWPDTTAASAFISSRRRSSSCWCCSDRCWSFVPASEPARRCAR